MKWAILMGGLAWVGAALPLRAGALCGPEQKTVVESEVKCFPSGGVDIGYMSDEGVKVACMQDQRVKSVCGPDGQVTRLQAYRAWYSKLSEATAACHAKGGNIAFADPRFVEPTDETYCMQAQPEVGSNMFEGSLCNYRAVCPAITVVCEFSCRGTPDVTAYNTESIYPTEDESFLKRIAKR